MSDVDVSVKTSETAPAASPVPPHKTRWQIAWEVAEKWLFSTKLAATAVALFYLRSDHWGDVTVLMPMTDANQINGFVQLTQSKNTTTQNILLGYLGFTTVTGLGASVVNRFTQTSTTRPPARTASTKNLD